MADYAITITTHRPYDETVQGVRDQLGKVGFGVLTEIDLRATLKAKLDVDVAPQIILGACRPALAYEAVQADPSIAVLLPCNVVVRSVSEGTTVVEAFDPEVMLSFAGTDAGGDAVREVAADARRRLVQALTALNETSM